MKYWLFESVKKPDNYTEKTRYFGTIDFLVGAILSQ